MERKKRKKKKITAKKNLCDRSKKFYQIIKKNFQSSKLNLIQIEAIVKEQSIYSLRPKLATNYNKNHKAPHYWRNSFPQHDIQD
jgi:hypothetical protein